MVINVGILCTDHEWLMNWEVMMILNSSTQYLSGRGCSFNVVNAIPVLVSSTMGVQPF